MRKLVTKRIVDNLLPIQNADRIELAQVGGWTCIVKKGEFKVGDEGFFFEIDSFIPASDSRFEFLGKQKTYKRKLGYRIRTMKMKGVLSQGLMLPQSMFPELRSINVEDYAELLKVEKYDVEVASPRGSLKTGDAKGRFPSFIPKTDQPRLQNLLHYFEAYSDHEFEESLKLDGSSVTMYKIPRKVTLWDKLKSLFTRVEPKDYSFGVCSRNLEIKRSDKFEATFDNDGFKSTYRQSDFWEVAHKYEVEKSLPVGYAIQGELVGTKIQGNHENVDELEMYVFNIWNINEERYLTTEEKQYMMSGTMQKIPEVPIVSRCIKIFQECKTLDMLQDRVTGPSMNAGTISEGRVYVSTKDPHIHFKLISNKYLLKCEV